jgi:hypothetical protein
MNMKVTGNLVFEPDRGADFRKTGKLKTLILDLPGKKHRELARYYAKLIELEHGPWCNLLEPMFGTHITVVRGNGDRFDEERCKQVVNSQITVELDPTTLQRTPWSGKNPAFWYMKVVSPELTNLRKLLQVKPIFSYDAHLTVARESLDFYMHTEPPRYPVAVALAAAELIPGVVRSRKKGEARQSGNEALKDELLRFAQRAHRDPFCNGEALQALVYEHVKVPTADWQRELLNLFCSVRTS